MVWAWCSRRTGILREAPAILHDESSVSRRLSPSLHRRILPLPLRFVTIRLVGLRKAAALSALSFAQMRWRHHHPRCTLRFCLSADKEGGGDEGGGALTAARAPKPRAPEGAAPPTGSTVAAAVAREEMLGGGAGDAGGEPRADNPEDALVHYLMEDVPEAAQHQTVWWSASDNNISNIYKNICMHAW
jgi:hypothetical protein